MAAAADLLARLCAFPLVRDGRISLTHRRGGYSLSDAALDLPVVRLRPTGKGDQVALMYPEPRGGWMPPGAFGDDPLPLDETLEKIEQAIAFLDHVADAAPKPTEARPRTRRRSL